MLSVITVLLYVLQIKVCSRIIWSRVLGGHMCERSKDPLVPQVPPDHQVTAVLLGPMATSQLTSWTSLEVRIQTFHTRMETLPTYVSDTGKCCSIMSEFVHLLVRSPWHHPWSTRKPRTSGRKRVPRTQRRQGYVQITGDLTEEKCLSWDWPVAPGDPGRPGLPGLPGTYSVQIPQRVQKRDSGKMFKRLVIQTTTSGVAHCYNMFS